MRASRGLSFIASAVIGLGVMTGLVACTPDPPEPTPTASSSEPATPTPTPTPTTPREAVAPERPAAMDEISVAGAEAAAAYFLQLYPYVYATGDLAEWKALSHPECVFCASVIENVETQVAAGETNRGSAVEVASVVGLETTPGEWYSVDAVFVEGPSERLNASGEVISAREQPQEVAATLALVVEGTTWSVRALEVVDAGTGT